MPKTTEKAKPGLVPLADHIVVEPLDAEAASPGGIILPDTARQKPSRGRVVAAGPGRVWDDRSTEAAVVYAPMGVAVGDVVLFTRYAGTEVEVDGVEYKILRESDVLAKLTQAAARL